MAKKPTGNRPVPKVAQPRAAKGAGKMNKVAPSPKHTPMHDSRRNATMGDTSKRRGYV